MSEYGPGALSGPPPGWYRDPAGAPQLRWWDGRQWTDHTQPQPGAAQATPDPQEQWTRARARRPGKAASIVLGVVALAVVLVLGAIIASHSGGSGSGSSSGPCTTASCITSDVEGLKGTVAKDNSVMTKVTCQASTVKEVVSGTYTVHCTVTYSDGMVARGIASVLTASGDVDWEPTDILHYGSGD